MRPVTNRVLHVTAPGAARPPGNIRSDRPQCRGAGLGGRPAGDLSPLFGLRYGAVAPVRLAPDGPGELIPRRGDHHIQAGRAGTADYVNVVNDTVIPAVRATTNPGGPTMVVGADGLPAGPDRKTVPVGGAEGSAMTTLGVTTKPGGKT